ncbi:S8 family peptidase [Variovorax sp. J31P207]|uniref:S8 family peptidase n=1 Tax=Variovorax sp. J31P207 TaxID=3053510 RepID=UPI002576C25F|nr:S8 family peptidase [Variovorax sp. J31P207]MDM0065308.1 S8 family peptidase [Variovorax sp. J31P207]
MAIKKKPASKTAAFPAGALPHSDPGKKGFLPEVLDRSPIAIPLLNEMRAENEALAAASKDEKDPKYAKTSTGRNLYPVIIDINLDFTGGREMAGKQLEQLVDNLLADRGREWSIDKKQQGLNMPKSNMSQQYYFGVFEGRMICELITRDRDGKATGCAIFRIWPDFEVKPLMNQSICTIKADAALNAFSTTGDGIVWAVMDSGIDALHPHFAKFDNLNLKGVRSMTHCDLTALDGNLDGALIDRFGHGTHVAGIIAGSFSSADGKIEAVTRHRDERGEVKRLTDHPPLMSGMAPRCKLLSLKVLDDEGKGLASNLIAAIEMVQKTNGYGRSIRVHGVNMSVGYDFEPEWFACGQSPLCVEVDRLVKSGVVVVVAAGNTGYGFAQSQALGTVAAGLGLTVNDPGNAALALTVGSTHREMPHVYGVSYFSSKGPTGDGRAKPDLVAPGEKILSCASTWAVDELHPKTPAQSAESEKLRTQALAQRVAKWKLPTKAASATTATTAAADTKATARAGAKTGAKDPARLAVRYREDSGTSMAAPHVSGAIAAFLSVRKEFIGRPEKVKEIFLATATDLQRDRYFQGAGLVDLMRAIQSV